MSAARPMARGRFDRARLPDPLGWFEAQGIALHGQGRWRTARCAFHDDRRPSMRVNVEGGGFYCPACDARGGDLVDFVRLRDGLPFAQAAQALGAWVGGNAAPERPSERAARLAAAACTRREAARQLDAEQRALWAGQAPRLAALWAAAHPLLPGDAASLYLKRRGLVLAAFPAALRYLPRLAYRHDDGQTTAHPAMLAAVLSPAGALVAIHRTYLRADGSKADVPCPRKLTRTAGPTAGAAIRLHPTRDDSALGVAEGIETALAAQLASGVPTWAAVSAHGLQSFAWPVGTRRLIVFADHDASGTGQRAADSLAQRARAAGLSVSVLLPQAAGSDWADVWAQRCEVTA